MTNLLRTTLAALLCTLALTLSTTAYHIDYPEGYTPYYNHHSAQALARLVWAEGRGIPSDTEKAAIMWCVINRVEREGAWADNILRVLTQRGQFAYRESAPVDPALYELAKDVLTRWDMERCGYTDVGRVLPSEYCWFTGWDGHNWFRAAYSSKDYWDWSLSSPYGS